MIRSAFRLLFLACCAVAAASAESIAWFSDIGATNLDSSGAAMTAGYEFQLGVFSGGFEPSAANTAEWPDHWQAAATTPYNADTNRFAGLFEVTGNAAPFTVGAKAWIFGRRDIASGSEWILFRANHWLWPAPNPMNPISVDWDAKDATIVVLGEINASGSPFLMKSSALTDTPPPMNWSEWQGIELAGQTLTGPEDDPDGDGVPNLLEFVFGTSPTTAGPPPVMPISLIEIGGLRYLQIDIPRRADRNATLVVEVSGDLATWDSGSAFTTLVSDTVESLVVRDLTPLGPPAKRRFIRLRASVPAP